MSRPRFGWHRELRITEEALGTSPEIAIMTVYDLVGQANYDGVRRVQQDGVLRMHGDVLSAIQLVQRGVGPTDEVMRVAGLRVELDGGLRMESSWSGSKNYKVELLVQSAQDVSLERFTLNGGTVVVESYEPAEIVLPPAPEVTLKNLLRKWKKRAAGLLHK